jgi:regulator of protease activity HflC (stomatin/prohibitin superfamily)
MIRRIRRSISDRGPEIAVFVVLFTIIAVMLTPRMIYTIPVGHVGVLWKRFGGTVLDRTLGEGLTVILPWDKVYIYDLRLQLVDQDFEALSADGLKVSIDIAYRFWLMRDQVPLLHKTVGPGYADIMLSSAMGARARDVLGRNTPEEIYSFRRAAIQDEILKEMQADLRTVIAPQVGENVDFIHLEDVFVRAIRLPPNVEEAINRKNQMQQKSLEYDYRLILESKESERKRIEARGIKEFQDIVSQGITESYLRWRGIDATQALANSPNTKTIIIGNGKDGLPIILGNADGNAPAAAPTPPVSDRLGTSLPPMPSKPDTSLPDATSIVPPDPAARSGLRDVDD